MISGEFGLHGSLFGLGLHHDLNFADDDVFDDLLAFDDLCHDAFDRHLTSRITTAAAADGQSANRATTVSGLQPYYGDTLKAYADITPGDGQTTTFTPSQPPAGRR